MVVSRHDLEELFIVGSNVEIPRPDDPDNPIRLYVRKLSPAQQEKAVRRAQATRIKYSKLWERDEEDVDRLILMAEVDEVGDRDDMIRFIADIEIAGQRAAAEQELSEEEEWAKNGYLQGLLDAWDAGMKDTFVETTNEEDLPEDVAHVWSEIKRFSDELEFRLKRVRENREVELDVLDDAEIRRRVFDVFVERQAGTEWLRMYRNHQILFGVLDPETKQQIFEEVEDIGHLPIEVYKILLSAVMELALPPVELKS